LCGILTGLLVHYFSKDKPLFNFSEFKEPANRDTNPDLLFRFVKNVWRNIKATGLYFLLGIALSAVFQRYVNAEDFAALFGNGTGALDF